MDIKQLQYFVTVVESGGFSAAGGALNLAQSSLSRHIAQLEKELGQRLLHRTGRGATPTQAGKQLLAHARTMLDVAKQVRAEMEQLQESPSGRLVLGLPPRVAVTHSADLIRAFRRRFPRAVISVSEALSIHLREWLMAGRVDVALLFDPPPSPQLSYLTLSQESLRLVMPANSATTSARLPTKVSLADLAHYPMILPSPPNAIRSLVDAALLSREIQLRVVAEVSAVQTVLTLVSQGVGCTLLPESALEPAHLYKDLVHVAVGPPSIRNKLVLAVPKAGPYTPLVLGVLALIQGMNFQSQAQYVQTD